MCREGRAGTEARPRRDEQRVAPVLEPVGHLRVGEAGALRELALLLRRRILVVRVRVLQRRAALLLEAVDRLFAVPDARRQLKLLAQPILVHRAELAAFLLLGL